MKDKKTNLTLAQKKFCELYASDKEFFGNGVQSYAEAYNIKLTKKTYKSCYVRASTLLRNIKVLQYINTMLDIAGFNNANVDKQHNFLINQDSDLAVKRAAIADYNKLKGRIIEKLEHTGRDGKDLFEDFKEISDSELDKKIETALSKLKSKK